MPSLINEIIVRQLSDEFTRAEGMVIVSLSGLTVRETEDLRIALAKDGVRLRMVRNRLAQIALKNRGLEAGELFAGNVACAWGSSEEAVKIAKVVAKAIKKVDPKKKKAVLAFRGGFFEGNLIDPKGAAALADLPGKDELRAMMLGLISGPARSLATLIQGPPASLTRAINARVTKGDAGEPTATS